MIIWQEKHTPEEQHVTREVMRISVQVTVLVRDDVLAIPEDASEDLQARMVRLEPYLRWAAGLPATHWLPGGPANFPEGVDPTQRTGVEGLSAEMGAA